jgi:gluconate 2-dehydrogenase gamma chain
MSESDKPNGRREFLRKLSIIPIAGVAGAGLATSVSATAATSAESDYKPTFFNDKEWLFINMACDRLIPSDSEGPGALELGVPEFIDRQMNTPYGQGGLWYMQGPFIQANPLLGYQLQMTPQQIYRIGIADAEKWCEKNLNKSFSELDNDGRERALSQMDKGEAEFDRIPSTVFFSFLLQNTREGYFSDPQYGGNKNMGSWKMIGFPGARADFMDWVNQDGKAYPYGPVSISGKRG